MLYEVEAMAMCADTGVGLVPYSPKAKAAWHAPGASSPPGPVIVGATRRHHLPEAIAALELNLTSDDVAMLEKPCSNHGPSWY